MTAKIIKEIPAQTDHFMLVQALCFVSELLLLFSVLNSQINRNRFLVNERIERENAVVCLYALLYFAWDFFFVPHFSVDFSCSINALRIAFE